MPDEIPLTSIRLCDLQEWHELWGVCSFCRHRGLVDVAEPRLDEAVRFGGVTRDILPIDLP